MRKLAALFLVSILVSLAPPGARASATAGGLEAVSREGHFRLATLTGENGSFTARLQYPVFGRPALDQGIRTWVERFFSQETAELKRAHAKDEKPKRHGDYAITPRMIVSSWGTVSIAFGLSYMDRGAAHPSHDIRTVTFDARGKELGYEDLFRAPEGLWFFFSDHARSSLRARLAAQWESSPELYTEGLAPKPESFKRFVVTPGGLTLLFPRYQVAAYGEGEQRCDVPLNALAGFSPKPGIWGPEPRR